MDYEMQAQATAIQKELVRTGPLCVALAVDTEAFTALLSGGTPPVVADSSEGLFYQPRHVNMKGPLHAALLVGYSATQAGVPFWICRSHVGALSFGYTLQTGEKTTGSLFNVGMYDENSQLLRHVLSFDQVSILTSPGGTAHALRTDDPLTAPLSEAISLETPLSKAFPDTRMTPQHFVGFVFWSTLVIVLCLALVISILIAGNV